MRMPGVLMVAVVVSTAPLALCNEPSSNSMNSAKFSVFQPPAFKWQPGPPSRPKGAQITVLEGDPTKEGPFVFRVKVPDGYRIPPHTRPKMERVTVISGTFNIGMGEKFDQHVTREMTAGTYGHWNTGMGISSGSKARPSPSSTASARG